MKIPLVCWVRPTVNQQVLFNLAKCHGINMIYSHVLTMKHFRTPIPNKTNCKANNFGSLIQWSPEVKYLLHNTKHETFFPQEYV